ncbi:DUF1707 domain-containing protein [Actinomycetes bacterium KLBMP 9797]
MANQLERVGNSEREATAALLGDAMAGGYLDGDEFAERTAAAYAARTRDDLAQLVADLPTAFVRERVRRQRRERHVRGARIGIWAHVAAYVAGSILMIGIWAAVGIGAGSWYFWPVWPILGWGLGLLGHVIPVRAVLSRHTTHP